MNQRDTRNTLKRIGKQVIVPDSSTKETQIARLRELEVNLEVSKRGTPGDFFFSQIRFVNKLVFLWQGVWIIAFICMMRTEELFHLSQEALCIVSMAPPLLLILTVEDIAQVYHRSMLEIEYATKYSLKKIVMARMLLVSSGNGIMLMIGIVVASKELGMEIAEIFVYGITPLLWMSVLLIFSMKYLKGIQLIYGAISIYILLALVILGGKIGAFEIYRTGYYEGWILLCIGGFAALIYGFRLLLGHLETFEVLIDS